jgi:phosphohistidine swiveling domain-containing protein
MKMELQEEDLSLDIDALKKKNPAFGDAPLVLERNENADPGEVIIPCAQEFYEKVFAEKGPFWNVYSELSFASRPVNAQYVWFVSGRMYYLKNTEQRFLYKAGPIEEYIIKDGRLATKKRASIGNLLLLLSMPFDASRQQAGIIELGFLANEAVKEFEAYAKEAREYHRRASEEIEDPYSTAKESLSKAVEAMKYANLATLCGNLKVRLRQTPALERCEASELKGLSEMKDYATVQSDYGFYSLTPYDISKPRFREDIKALKKYGFPQAPMEYSMKWRENAKYACARYLDVERMSYQRIGKEMRVGDEVYYLRTEELAKSDNEKIIEQRMAEYREYAKTQPPAKIAVYNGKAYSEKKAHHEAKVLRGKSVSSQRTVRGTAFHIDSLDDYEKFKEGGVILSKNLSPNLTMLYSKAVAVVSETGSAMAHAAIIAREMKIPCIVEADISGIREGLKIEVDGLSGEIRVLD